MVRCLYAQRLLTTVGNTISTNSRITRQYLQRSKASTAYNLISSIGYTYLSNPRDLHRDRASSGKFLASFLTTLKNKIEVIISHSCLLMD